MAIDPNLRICYHDYLGVQQWGHIIYLEPAENEGDDVYWCYIKDIEEENNDKSINVDGQMMTYADIRLSTEIYID